MFLSSTTFDSSRMVPLHLERAIFRNTSATRHCTRTYFQLECALFSIAPLSVTYYWMRGECLQILQLKSFSRMDQDHVSVTAC